MFEIAMGIFLCVGLLFLLRGHLLSMLIGIILMGNAGNLLLFSISDPKANAFPFIGKNPTGITADPIPQALILTAIVISFAILCFMAALIKIGRKKYNIDSYLQLLNEDEIEGEGT